MKNNKLITPLILAGGSGTRLWPISRRDKPKQFLEIFDTYSLLQLTTLRCKNKLFNEPIFIVGEQHRFIVAEQLRSIGIKNPHIILEPEPKNTTAAITIGAFYSKNINLTDPLLILPSDHYIDSSAQFVDLMKKINKTNIEKKLICFGIQPTSPEVKYGYIIKKETKEDNELLKKINKFIEKPSVIVAKNLIKRDALWNSGMFFFSADSILNEVKLHAPQIFKNAKLALEKAKPDMDFIRLESSSFKRITSISIDHAIFEKSNNSYVVPTNLNWNDLGTYNALWGVGKKDKNNNVINGDVIIDRLLEVRGKFHFWDLIKYSLNDNITVTFDVKDTTTGQSVEYYQFKLDKDYFLNVMPNNGNFQWKGDRSQYEISPKVKIFHLLSQPDDEREQRSIASISELAKFEGMEYTQIINKPYTEFPPIDTCARPKDVQLNPGHYKLSPGHYGCYKAHTDIISSLPKDENTTYLFFECDAILTTTPKEYYNKLKEAIEISKEHNYTFFSFAYNYGIHNEYENHIDGNKIIETHSYFIMGDKIDRVQKTILNSKWDTIDLWITNNFQGELKGFYREPLVLQASGYSLLDQKTTPNLESSPKI